MLTVDDCPIGYAILKAMRKFQIFDMYMSYQEHTQDSLSALHGALLAWDDVIEVCSLFQASTSSECQGYSDPPRVNVRVM